MKCLIYCLFLFVFLLVVRFAKSVHKAKRRRISFSTAQYSTILEAGDLILISKDVQFYALSGHLETKF